MVYFTMQKTQDSKGKIKLILIFISIWSILNLLIYISLTTLVNNFNKFKTITIIENISPKSNLTNAGVISCLQSYISPGIKNNCLRLNYKITQTATRDPRGVIITCTTTNPSLTISDVHTDVLKALQTCTKKNQRLLLDVFPELMTSQTKNLTFSKTTLILTAVSLGAISTIPVVFILAPVFISLIKTVKLSNEKFNK